MHWHLCLLLSFFTTLEFAGALHQSTFLAAETSHGVVMGLYCAQILLPLALSFSNGLAAAVANIKSMLPGDVGLGYGP